MRRRVVGGCGWPAVVLALGLVASGPTVRAEEVVSSPVVIYGASPGGIMAAVAAARDGVEVVVVEPTKYVGGIVAQGGLVLTDLGDEKTIGGLAREFFQRVADHYRQTYGKDSDQLDHTKFQGYLGGCYEPRVAEMVYEDYLKSDPKITVLREVELGDVQMADGKIVSFTGIKPDGSKVRVEGQIFLDATSLPRRACPTKLGARRRPTPASRSPASSPTRRSRPTTTD